VVSCVLKVESIHVFSTVPGHQTLIPI
jgi:hypothetical protein